MIADVLFYYQKKLILGGGIDGSNCNKILLKLDSLASDEVVPIINCLQSFKFVLASCFSDKLLPDYKDRLLDFGAAYLELVNWAEVQNLKLRITWKVHILIAHLEGFIEKNQCGLARFAEQAGEAIHAKFKPTWQWYKRNVNHSDHGNKLLCAVAEFSSKRR